MAQKKFSQLPADASPTATDSIPTYDVETGLTKRTLISSLISLFFSSPTITSPTVVSPPTNIARLTGEISDYGGRTAPTDWLFCEGSAVSRTTYAALFAVLVPSVGTFTVTIASPAVATLTAHALQTGDQVYLTTTGALPTGLSANTLYYAIRIDANTFNLATSRANAYAGTKINTSGTQSGVHTVRACDWGLGDGSTTFNVPDLRGRVLAGNDSLGGTVASRLTLAHASAVYGNKGSVGGAQTHVLVIAELAAHTHTYATDRGGVGYAGGANNSKDSSLGAAGSTTGSTGTDTAHNNVQPTAVINKIIKT